MPKSPGYSSITNSFPSTVLPAGFFTTPRRTFRVFVVKKADGEIEEKNCEWDWHRDDFQGEISLQIVKVILRIRFWFKESPQKISFIWNQYVCNFEIKRAEEGTSVKKYLGQSETTEFRNWASSFQKLKQNYH